MPSHMRTYQFSGHQLPYQHGLLEPCPHELQQHSANTRQYPKRHQISQRRFRPSLEITPDAADALPTFAEDSIFQASLGWNSGDEQNNFPSQTFRSASQFEQRTLIEDEIRRHILENPPSAELSSNPWLAFASTDS